MRYKALHPKNKIYQEGDTLFLTLRRSPLGDRGLYLDGHKRYRDVKTPQGVDTYIGIWSDKLPNLPASTLHTMYSYMAVRLSGFKSIEGHQDLVEIE